MQEQIFKDNYEMLNPAQKEVIEQIYGPVMVVAGPGTGKTQIIALRTANIIAKTDVNPENILITTFTEAGVVAIKKRLIKFIGTEAYKVKVSTIHSFSQDIITSYPEKFAEFKAISTIDDIESLEVLTKILDENIKNNNITELFTAFDRYMYLRDIKDRIGKLKGEGVSIKKFEKIISELRAEYDQKLEDLKSNKRIRDLEKRTTKDSDAFNKHITKLNELNFIYKLYGEYLRENSL
ncbi:MAG: UvrD-helicase domain-containing protein [Candidatus Gracilibacteria bacterium]|nr:UvrD-helicase domain-containing protein [Candidatus Gracilibacteria bacterium]